MIVLMIALAGFFIWKPAEKNTGEIGMTNTHFSESKETLIFLPKPQTKGTVSLEETLYTRRSHRRFSSDALQLQEISQILWAAQGITDKTKEFRTAPSAGALYPLDIYLIAGQINDIPSGIYRYIPAKHALERTLAGDQRDALYKASLEQSSVRQAPASILIVSVWNRITEKYGNRGRQYALLEAGHVGQNIMLQCVALNLASLPIGAYYDEQVHRVVNLRKGEDPVYLFPVGRKR